jgi:opacity protein-like surface antigen
MAKKNALALALLLGSALTARVAAAQNATPWDGWYFGVNLGGQTSSSCSTATLNGPNIDATTTTFSGCGSGSVLGGVQFGENFQIKKLVFGVGADVVLSETKTDTATLNFAGAAPPPGTYALSGKFGPKDFAIIGGRIGYGGRLLFPYLRAGAVVAGTQNSALSYTPAGATAPIASFGGGKSFNSTGWAAGAGAEIGLNGAWSISAEYLRMNLGRGSSTATTCGGVAGACAPFAGVSLDTTHNAYTANLIRIGISYWFNYWDKP